MYWIFVSYILIGGSSGACFLVRFFGSTELARIRICPKNSYPSMSF